MADDITISPIGTPYPVVTDELAGARHVQVMKAGFGADGQLTAVSAATPLPTESRFAVPTAPRLGQAWVNANLAGVDNVLLAGTPGQTIGLFRIWFVVAQDVAFAFLNGTTRLHPLIPLLANGAFVLDFDGEPWFTTGDGLNLQVELSTAVQVSGQFYYRKG
jgi:hypothetical protein